MVEYYKRNPNTSCKVCGKKIYRRPGVIAENNGNAFCSQTCYGKFCRREIPCVVCGKLILGSLHKRTCSRTCSNKHREGIKYKIGRPRDKARTIYLLKLRLLEIRGGKCERCDYSRTSVLQVHHKDRNRNNSDINNLELVCPNCHYEEHYSKHEEQWLKNQADWKSRSI